ncbi:MAG: hypothetical protein ABEJ00_00020, partial [Gemmatimonadota bacterium]
MQTRIDVDHGPYEELYLLHPEDEEALEYEAEHHELRVPDLLEYEEVETEDGSTERKFRGLNLKPYVLGIGWLALATVAGGFALGSHALGAVVGAVVLVAVGIARPAEGY